jgi:hypothetical protein
MELTTFHPSRDEPVSHSVPIYKVEPEKWHIWQVARATSAAPTYFKPLYVDGIQYVDGGVTENNPTHHAINGVRRLYGINKPGLVLSVGTGLPRRFIREREKPKRDQQSWLVRGWKAVSDKPNELYDLAKDIRHRFTDCEITNQHWHGQARGLSTWYKRFNADTGVAEIGLGEWKSGSQNNTTGGRQPGGETLHKMEALTEKYLARDRDPFLDQESYAPPKQMLKDCAKKLVKRRRAREKAIENEKIRRNEDARDRLGQPTRAALTHQATTGEVATLESMTTEHSEIDPLKAVTEKRWDTYLGKYLILQYDDQSHLIPGQRDKPKTFKLPDSAEETGRQSSESTLSSASDSAYRPKVPPPPNEPDNHSFFHPLRVLLQQMGQLGSRTQADQSSNVNGDHNNESQVQLLSAAMGVDERSDVDSFLDERGSELGSEVEND